MSDAPRRLKLGTLVLLLQPYPPPRLWRVCGVEGAEEDAANVAFAEKTLSGRVWTQKELAAAVAKKWPLKKLAAKGREL